MLGVRFDVVTINASKYNNSSLVISGGEARKIISDEAWYLICGKAWYLICGQDWVIGGEASDLVGDEAWSAHGTR